MLLEVDVVALIVDVSTDIAYVVGSDSISDCVGLSI